jgi:hypothetical protein
MTFLRRGWRYGSAATGGFPRAATDVDYPVVAARRAVRLSCWQGFRYRLLLGEVTLRGFLEALGLIGFGVVLFFVCMQVLIIHERRVLARYGACARSLGLQHYSGKPGHIGRCFYLTSRAGLGAAPGQNALGGRWKGRPVWFSEYKMKIDDDTWLNHPVACADLSVTVPHLKISRKIRFAGRAESAAPSAPDQIARRFSRQFRVTSQDGQFERKLLDADVMAWLLSAASPKFTIEMAGSQLIAWRDGRIRPEPWEITPLLDTVAEFAARIPQAVLDDYATARPRGLATRQRRLP